MVPKSDKCTPSSPLVLPLPIPFVYFFDNPHCTTMEQRIPDLQTPSSRPAAATTPIPFQWGPLWGEVPKSDKCTLSSPLVLPLPSPSVYFFDNPHGAAMEQRISDLQIPSSRPAAATTPIPFQWGPLQGEVPKSDNVQCRDPWRCLYLFPLSFSLIIHMVQV